MKSSIVIVGVIVVMVLALVGWAVGQEVGWFGGEEVEVIDDAAILPVGEGDDETRPVNNDGQTQLVDDNLFAEEPEELVEVAVLQAVGGYSGSGAATRSWDGSAFTHDAMAMVGDPAAGKFYEGWLVNDSGKFFSTGKMVAAPGPENVYTLEYQADVDYSEYNQVVITEETEANGLDGQPEAHVLEGEFEVLPEVPGV